MSILQLYLRYFQCTSVPSAYLNASRGVNIATVKYFLRSKNLIVNSEIVTCSVRANVSIFNLNYAFYLIYLFYC